MTAADIPIEPRFRLRLVPILVTAALGLVLPAVAAYATLFGAKALGIQLTPGMNLPWLYAQHAAQLVFALVAIAVLKYRIVPGNYGLHWPKGKTYIWQAILWGSLFGVMMAIPGNLHHLIAHTRPDIGYTPTPANITGWLFFEGVYVGPTEEIPFRALLVTYLIATMPGKLHVGRFNMSWAGIIVAVIFALAHAGSFFAEGWQAALVQQGFAFALGVLYAYWLEKSQSIVAPILAHNCSDGVVGLIMVCWGTLL